MSLHAVNQLLPSLLTPSHEEPRWYAVYTRSRHEQRVFEQLCTTSSEVFLPMMETVRQWSDRRKRIQVPLFPGYLFVKIPWLPAPRVDVLKVPGVVRIISNCENPAPVPEEQILAIQRFIALEMRMDPCPYIRIGRRVEIRRGALKGLQGILLRKKGQYRFVISVDLIQKSVSVEVNAEDLLPIY